MMAEEQLTNPSCPKCGNLNEGTAATFCPRCGTPLYTNANPKSFSWKRVASLALAGCAGVMIISFLAPSPSSSNSYLPSALQNSSASLSCLSVQTTNAYGHNPLSDQIAGIMGTVGNSCGRPFSYVQVTYKLFDKTGNVVGTAMANQSNLGDGETWKFDAVGLCDSATHYKLDEVLAH
jgi:hypothetical protein